MVTTLKFSRFAEVATKACGFFVAPRPACFVQPLNSFLQVPVCIQSRRTVSVNAKRCHCLSKTPLTSVKYFFITGKKDNLSNDKG